MAYSRPRGYRPCVASANLFEISKHLRVLGPLDYGDPRYVELSAARGDFSYGPLLRSLGVHPKTYKVEATHDAYYGVLCGHLGSGKSTELRWLEGKLRTHDTYFVVLVDIASELDVHNFDYADLLYALANHLVGRLQEAGVRVPPGACKPLEDWFIERIENHEGTRDYAAEIKAGVQVESGLPLLGKLFGGLTTSMKTQSTYKEELRKVVKNSFSSFADAFGRLLEASEKQLAASSKPALILFLVDGTDRLSEEQGRRFFVGDINQLRAVRGRFIYCAPIRLVYQLNLGGEGFDHIQRLPMVKLREKHERARLSGAYEALRALVYARAAPEAFDAETTLDYLIEMSGGHPRDLLRLLGYCFERTKTDRFDRASAEAAVKQLASDYRRLLRSDDYDTLAAVDLAPKGEANRTKNVDHLLANTVLLEYNDFWWMSHPVVQTLDGYRSAYQRLKTP